MERAFPGEEGRQKLGRMKHHHTRCNKSAFWVTVRGARCEVQGDEKDNRR